MTPQKKTLYTLITGGCKGIGKAFAIECAARGMNTLLVSEDENCLRFTCNEIRSKFRIKCDYLAIDLTRNNSCIEVLNWVKRNSYNINFLINNVGAGKSGYFSKMELSEAELLIDLNTRVLTKLTRVFIDELKRNGKSYILNMSSIEATLPLPYKTVYTATKSYIYAFSLALNQELKKDQIHVSVVCPGPVITNKEGIERLNSHGKRAKLLVRFPEYIAKIALDGTYKEKDVIVPGTWNKIFFQLGTVLPRGFKMRLLERLFRVYQN